MSILSREILKVPALMLMPLWADDLPAVFSNSGTGSMIDGGGGRKVSRYAWRT